MDALQRSFLNLYKIIVDYQARVCGVNAPDQREQTLAVIQRKCLDGLNTRELVANVRKSFQTGQYFFFFDEFGINQGPGGKQRFL